VHEDADPVLKVEQLLADDADHGTLHHLGKLQQGHSQQSDRQEFKQSRTQESLAATHRLSAKIMHADHTGYTFAAHHT
jgi:hypothetical protein